MITIGTMWQDVHWRAACYPKDDSMLPTIEQAKELVDNCNIQIFTEDGARYVVVQSRRNGDKLSLDSGIYSSDEPVKVCMIWLKTPVENNPEWGYAMVIGDLGVSFQSFPKSEKLYTYLVKVRPTDIISGK